MSSSHLMSTYGRLPVSFTKGKGVWLTDRDGKRYLDAISGIGVCNLGHCHPEVTQAIQQQAATLIHTSNIYHIEAQEVLADKLSAVSGMDQCFFSNSGAEANEAAIKIARLYGHNKGINEPQIIVMEGSFHGRTMATLSATGNRKVQAGFEPLVPGFVRAPFNDMTALKAIANNNSRIVAVMVEPIQGEGGINIPDNDYLSQLRQLCDTQGWLMMLDEVQTGNGRTGRYFAFQHHNLTPDVLTTAKGLGNGLPIGVCLAKGVAAEQFKPGHHGSTYGGNPLVCTVASTVLDTLTNSVIPQVDKTSQHLIDRLETLLAPVDIVTSIDHIGLMIGIKLHTPCPELVTVALNKGLLINVTADCVIRLLPPLTINEEEVEFLASTVADIVSEFARQQQKTTVCGE